MTEILRQLLGYAGQLLVLGVFGGAVTWFYARLQRNRDLRLQLLRDFASLHGRFVALRYRANSFYVQWSEDRSPTTHPLSDEERRLERWKLYEETCELIGEFIGLQPIVLATFPTTTEDVNTLHRTYQEWRRTLGANRPILQNTDGKSEDAYHLLRDAYARVVRQMRSSI